MNEQPKRSLRVVDGCSFTACVLLAITAGVALVVVGSPIYLSSGTSAVAFWKSLVEASVRALAIGAPITLLFGLPVLYWLHRRVQSAGLMVALLGVAGMLPGAVILLVGLAAPSELLFIGIYLIAGGAWSAVLGATLFNVFRGVPAAPITLAALLIGAEVSGALLCS